MTTSPKHRGTGCELLRQVLEATLRFTPRWEDVSVPREGDVRTFVQKQRKGVETPSFPEPLRINNVYSIHN